MEYISFELQFCLHLKIILRIPPLKFLGRSWACFTYIYIDQEAMWDFFKSKFGFVKTSAAYENIPWKAKCFATSVPISWRHLRSMNDVWPILNPHWSFGVYINTHQNIKLNRGCAQMVAKAYTLHDWNNWL